MVPTTIELERVGNDGEVERQLQYKTSITADNPMRRCIHNKNFEWTYYVLCIVMLMASSFLIVWMMTGHDSGVWWVVILEVLVTLVIVFEVAIKMCAFGGEFWSDYWNILDFIVAVLCAGGLVVYAWKNKADDEVIGHPKEDDDLGAVIILVVRYAAQLLRMVSLISRAKQTRDRLKSQKEIEFEGCDDGEMSAEFSVLSESTLDMVVPNTPGRSDWLGYDDDDGEPGDIDSGASAMRGLDITAEMGDEDPESDHVASPLC